MPRVVDHDARRAEVAKVAYDLIAVGGAEVATIRKVASAAGYSTTIVSHYFTSKKDLLQAVMDLSLTLSQNHVLAASTSGDLQSVLEAILPISEVQKQNWRIWFGFWGEAVSDHDFREQQGRQSRDTLELMKAFMLHAGYCLTDEPEQEAEDLARRTLSVVTGLATLASFDPGYWPAERQKKVIEEYVETLETRK